MKRLPIIILLIASMLILSLEPTNASIKVGSSCSKLNSKVTLSGIEYKCLKSGKKLLWSRVKPISSKSEASQGTLIDQKKINLEAEKLNFKNDMVFRYADGFLERRADNKTFFAHDSRLASDFDSVRAVSFDQIYNHTTANSHPKILIDYQISPTFPKLLVAYSKAQIEEVANYWNFAIETSTSFTVKLITEKDRESVLNDPLMYSGMDQALDRFAAWNPTTEQIFFTGGGGYLRHQTDNVYKGLLMLATSSKAFPERMNFEWPAIASHEITHVVQGYFFKDRLASLTPDQYQAVSPNNFREGTANLFGYALSLKNLGWYSDALDKNLFNCITSSKSWVRANDEADIVALITATEIRTPEEAHTMSYPIGALLYEWMLYKYGFAKVIEVFKAQGNSIDYSANISQTLGISKIELYKEAAPYVLSAIKRVLRN